MFSANVQPEVRKNHALKQFVSIQDICEGLNKEAHKQNFFQQSPKEIAENANRFVELFADENGMQSRTIQPLAWSFSVGKQKLFDDGVVELIIDKDIQFVYAKVERSKITQNAEEAIPQTKESLFGENNIYAHQSRVEKLMEQISAWEKDLEEFGSQEKAELKGKLKALESMLGKVKSSANKVSREALAEIEQQWNSLSDSINKVKQSIRRSS